MALVVRDALAALGVATYAKVTGGLGVHVVVRLAPGHAFAETKAVARRLAQALRAAEPERITDAMARHLRAGRVFVDWSQNDPGKSSVAAYSLRGGHIPTVAMPVEWNAVADAVRSGDHRGLVFTPVQVLATLDAPPLPLPPPQRLKGASADSVPR